MAAWLTSLTARKRRHPLFGVDTPLGTLRYVVLDTELTSLDPRSKRVVSLGAIAMQGSRICIGEQLYRVINPGVAVPGETVLIHRLRPVDVSQGEAPSQAVREFVEFSAGSILVGHFVHIDIDALLKEFPEARGALANPAIDTARVQRWLDLRQVSNHEDRGYRTERLDLGSLAERHGIRAGEAHHALNDAFLTAQLWQRQLHQLERAGISSLGKLLRFGRAS